MTDKEIARELFFMDKPQKTIASIVKKSEQTICKWAEEENWDEERALQKASEKGIKKRILALIDYELRVIEQENEENLKTGGKLKHIDKGHVDALSKLLSGVKSKELTFAEKVKLVTDFCEHIADQDPKLAKELIKFSDSFIYKISKDK